MMSTVETRYQIGCECCGHLTERTNLKEAKEAAVNSSDIHSGVFVFDRMARVGKNQLWIVEDRQHLILSAVRTK